VLQAPQWAECRALRAGSSVILSGAPRSGAQSKDLALPRTRRNAPVALEQRDSSAAALPASAPNDGAGSALRAGGLHPLPVTAGALLWPALEALAREAVLHQPDRVTTTWDTPLRTALARMRALRRVVLAGAPITTHATLLHLAADAAINRRRPAAVVIAGETPALALRRVLAWAARLPHRALVDAALDESQLRSMGRAAARIGTDSPISFGEGYRQPQRLANEVRGAMRWLITHEHATRLEPALIAVSFHAVRQILDLGAPAMAPIREILLEIAHEPRVQLLAALPFPNGVPVTPPLPQLPLAWRGWVDGTVIHTGWPTREAPMGGMTLHLERHLDGAVTRAHADVHPSGRLLPFLPPPESL
jgi:hypothetical protein